jgi:hypothetical protein
MSAGYRRARVERRDLRLREVLDIGLDVCLVGHVAAAEALLAPVAPGGHQHGWDCDVQIAGTGVDKGRRLHDQLDAGGISIALHKLVVRAGLTLEVAATRQYGSLNSAHWLIERCLGWKNIGARYNAEAHKFATSLIL